MQIQGGEAAPAGEGLDHQVRTFGLTGLNPEIISLVNKEGIGAQACNLELPFYFFTIS